MADVLSQSEVESLLAALDPGVSAVGNVSSLNRGEQVSGFRHPAHAPLESMLALRPLREGFDQDLSEALSVLLTSTCEVKLVSDERLAYDDFVVSLEHPACISLVESSGPCGQLVLSLDPAVVFPMVDRLLGGGKSIADGRIHRPLTEIEVGLATRIIDVILNSLRDAWDNICKLQPRVIHVESDPQLVQLASPDEAVVVLGFEISMTGARGILNLCIPTSTIDFMASRLTSDSGTIDRKEESGEVRGDGLDSESSLSRVAFEVRIADTTLSPADVIALRVGDIIMTESRSDRGAEIVIDGRSVFRGVPGVYEGRKAIRITETLKAPAVVSTGRSEAGESDRTES